MFKKNKQKNQSKNVISFKNAKKENIKVKKLPTNPLYEMLINLFLKTNKKDKDLTLVLLKYTEKSGASLRKGIENKIRESKKKKNVILQYLLLKVLYYMDIKGYTIVEAMYKSRFINSKEKSILLKSRTFSEGIEQITSLSKRSSKLLLNHFLLLAPTYIMIVVLLATQDIIKGVLEGMVAPIKSAGGTPPPLPHYMTDPTVYIYVNVVAWSLLIVVLLFYYYLKYKNVPMYFKIFILNEQEYVLNVLESISSLTKSGINLTDTVKILFNDEKNVVKKELYEKIYINFIKGNVSLSQIFEHYNVNYSTIGLISMGEETNNIQETLKNATLALEETYNMNMKIYGKIAFYGGQLMMFLVIMKPLIDILMYTSIQQLNFTT